MWIGIFIIIFVCALIVARKLDGAQKQSEEIKRLKDQVNDLNCKIDQGRFLSQTAKLRYLFVDKTIADTTTLYIFSSDLIIDLFEKQMPSVTGSCSEPFLADLIVEIHPVGDEFGIFVMLPVCGVCDLDEKKYYKQRLIFSDNSITTIKESVLGAYGDIKYAGSQVKESMQTGAISKQSESDAEAINRNRKHVLLWIADAPRKPYPVLLTATEAVTFQLGNPRSVDDSKIAAGLIYAFGCENFYSELASKEIEEFIERIAENIPKELIKNSDPTIYLCEDLSIKLRDHFGSDVMLVFSIGCYKLTRYFSFRRRATLDLYDLLVKEIKELSQPNQRTAWVMDSENFAIHSLDKTVVCKDPRIRYAVSVVKEESYNAKFPDFTADEKIKIGGPLGTVCYNSII